MFGKGFIFLAQLFSAFSGSPVSVKAILARVVCHLLLPPDVDRVISMDLGVRHSDFLSLLSVNIRKHRFFLALSLASL